MLFVEVTNPTQRPLELSRLRYSVAADGGQPQQGELRLDRNVIPGASAVFEFPIQMNVPGPVVLTGRLYAKDDRIERSWKVSAQAPFPGVSSSGNDPFRIRIADAALR